MRNIEQVSRLKAHGSIVQKARAMGGWIVAFVSVRLLYGTLELLRCNGTKTKRMYFLRAPFGFRDYGGDSHEKYCQKEEKNRGET